MRKLFLSRLLLLAVFLIPTSAWSAVSFDAVGPAGGAGAATTVASGNGSLSWTHTMGAGSGGYLVVGCAFGGNVTDAGVNLSATYNGSTMSSAGSVIHANNASNGFAQIFNLQGPTIGSNTVTVSVTGTTGGWSLECGSTSFIGAGGSGNYNTAAGSSTSPALTVTSASGDMVVDVLAAGSPIASSGKTLQWLNNQNGNSAGGEGAGSTAAGSSSVSMSYTITSDYWGEAGEDIQVVSSGGPTSTITWNNLHQQIYGFGAANHALNPSMTSAQQQFFSNPSTGLGYSILRMGTPEGSGNDSGPCGSVSSSCANGGDFVSDAQAFQANGARIIISAWSPPGAMKSNGQVVCTSGGGNGTLNTGSYGAFANYLVNYILSLAGQGVTVSAVSPSNEGNICPGYDGTLWNSSQLDTFTANNLGPALAGAGLGNVGVFLPESTGYNAFTDSPCVTDTNCLKYLISFAFHGYDNSFSISNPGFVQFWQTEVSAGSGFGPSLCGGCWDPSLADAMMWANIIDYNVVDVSENLWIYWWTLNQNGDNEGLIGPGGPGNYNTTAIRAYVLGNYSKFIRPGWYRIDATHTPASGVLVSAYRSLTTGQFCIVATNLNGSGSNIQFSFSGFNSSQVTAWVTSGSSLLQSAGTVSTSSGTSFVYTLPGNSVTSFVGVQGAATSGLQAGGPLQVGGPMKVGP